MSENGNTGKAPNIPKNNSLLPEDFKKDFQRAMSGNPQPTLPCVPQEEKFSADFSYALGGAPRVVCVDHKNQQR